MRTTKPVRTIAEVLKSPVTPLHPEADVFSKDCPSREVLNHVTSRWGVLVLVALLDRTHRFSELRRRIAGVSEKMLAQTLQALEADGFVQRHDHQVVPPHVTYTLSPAGREVAQRVHGLVTWIEANLGAALQAQTAHRAAA
jgi:DNA-binding HxlR family transcriptional regulator